MKKFFIISFILTIFIFLTGIYFYLYSIKSSEKSLKIKGKTFIKGIYPSVLNSIKFSAEIDKNVLKDLNLLAEALKEKIFKKEKLFEYCFKWGLFEITILDKENRVLESTKYKKDEILKKERIIKGIENEIEEDTLYFLKDFENKKILILKDLRGIKLLKREYGVKNLLEEISKDPEIDFFFFQAKEGVVFGTKLPENILPIEKEEFLKNALKVDTVCTREIINDGKRCFEFVKSVEIFGEKEGVLRIGFSMDNYFIFLKNLRNLFLIFLILTVFFLFLSILFLRVLKENKDIKIKGRIINALKNYKNPSIFVNEKGEIIFINKKGEEILKVKGIIGKNLFEIDKMDLFKIRKCMEEEREIDFEERIDGKIFSGNVFYFKDGKNKYFISILNDITEIKEKVKEEKFSGFSEFLAGLAHEIKNPLNLISLSISEIEREFGEEKVSKIKKAYINLKEKVEEFLLYLKPFDIEKKEIDVFKIFEEIEEENREILKRQNIDFKIEGERINIFSDYKKLKKIFSNIIRNSIEAQEEGGIIEVKIKRENGNLKIEISDRGIGIPEEDIEKIFSPFYTKKEKGAGLGLFIVKKLLEDLNGKINITSKYGFGTKVIVEIPLN